MNNKSRFLCTILLLFLAACTSATPALPPAATSTAIPSPIPDTPTATSEPDWAIVNNSLATNTSWISAEVKQEFDINIVDGTLVVIGPEEVYANPINTTGPRLELTAGDFGISFEMEAATADFAGISLYGALSQGEWWEGITRLDIGLKGGKVAVGCWNGTSPTPAVWQELSASGIYANKKISLGLRKLGNDLIILAKGHEIGRLPDPGLFVSNTVYFGVNVFPNNRLTLYNLSVEANNGMGVTIP